MSETIESETPFLDSLPYGGVGIIGAIIFWAVIIILILYCWNEEGNRDKSKLIKPLPIKTPWSTLIFKNIKYKPLELPQQPTVPQIKLQKFQPIIVKMKYCSYCGDKIKKDLKHCNYCGSKQ